ncbi:MAG: PqqD family protein [Candidatus Delongbacteria bacterium]|nr:PqqD family protein [Candidatus Delongbacteria bacterium]MBN2836618.1 PqqD family protein [Candidatus Delongbacteria bacterium]
MKKEKLQNLAVSDSGFIFDPITGHSYSTNEVGLEILNLLKKGESVDSIVSTMIEEYDTSRDELLVDIEDFIDTLKNYLLV